MKHAGRKKMGWAMCGRQDVPDADLLDIFSDLKGLDCPKCIKATKKEETPWQSNTSATTAVSASSPDQARPSAVNLAPPGLNVPKEKKSRQRAPKLAPWK